MAELGDVTFTVLIGLVGNRGGLIDGVNLITITRVTAHEVKPTEMGHVGLAIFEGARHEDGGLFLDTETGKAVELDEGGFSDVVHCGNSIEGFYKKSSLLRLELKLMDGKCRTKVFDDIHGSDGDFVMNEIIDDFQRLTFGFTNRMPFEFVSIVRTFPKDDGGED